jgi:hypothetical protein
MTVLQAARWSVRVAGLVALLLGLLLWTGGGGGVRPLHMLVGIILVAGLWVVAALGLRSGVGPVLPAVALAWGGVAILFGLNQASILPGDTHVLVKVAHLVVGLVAIGISEALGAQVGRVRTTA